MTDLVVMILIYAVVILTIIIIAAAGWFIVRYFRGDEISAPRFKKFLKDLLNHF